MIVRGLSLKNFRSYESAQLHPCEGVNIIYGKNAQGKTNLLEALWLFGGGHSFRGSKDSEFVRFNSQLARLEMDFNSLSLDQTAEIVYTKDKKIIKINGIDKSGAELSQRVCAVVFSPEHMSLVKSGPAERRKFLDGAIARKKLRYAVMLSKYNKTLHQRNALLKDIFKHPELEEVLPVWNNTLSSLGVRIILERIKYIRELSARAEEFHNGISDSSETLKLDYFSTVSLSEFDGSDEKFIRENEEIFLQKLSSSQDDDIRLGSTCAGPHRDDIEITLNDFPARSFGSQGQQRSIVISMKLAEAKILGDCFGEEPVIILDDVLSELDSSRQDFLMNKISGSQVFLSCCDPTDTKLLRGGKIFKIEDSRITAEG